ncbi:GPI inositol deacylase [Haplosporangium sp. Z 767]|nr:GPI inositol deacylase [Haplosporangium sp. Z 767]
MHSTSIHISDPHEYAKGDHDDDDDSCAQDPFYLSMNHDGHSTHHHHPNSPQNGKRHPNGSLHHQPLLNGRSHGKSQEPEDKSLMDHSQDQDQEHRSHPIKPTLHHSQRHPQPDQYKESQYTTPESNGKPQATNAPRRSERLRYSNGYSQQGSPSHCDQRQNHPTRRLSASIQSNAASATFASASSSSSGTMSTPTSPSRYSLPYSHKNDHSVDDEQHNLGSERGNAYATTAQMNGRSRTRSKSHPELPNIPLLHTSRSPTFGCSFPMAIVFLASLALLGCIFHSNLYRQVDSKFCQDTYMQPKFYKLLGFDRQRTAFAGKYGLLLFRDQYDYKLQVEPLGIPALFIPGNAGSAKQMRSIAKEASKFFYETLAENQRNGKTHVRPIDFFTVDFNEEFSALHGHSLLEQAEFLNDAIAYILSLYNDDRRRADPTLPRPTSVLIVGHSMGGIVARSLFTMKNYLPGTVNTILTAATPHMVPPVTLDFEISNIYDRIESFWSRGFQGPEAPLSNVSLISIAGGNLDIVVSGDSGNIHNIVPQSHGFTVFTSSIPHAWLGSDHLSILWCNQIAAVIGRALVDVVDARYAQQVKPLEERMKVFRNRFLTGIDDSQEESADPKSEEEVIVVSDFAHTIVESGSALAYPLKNSAMREAEQVDSHLYIMPIPRKAGIDTLVLLTNHHLGMNSRLDVLLCRDLSAATRTTPSSNPTRMSCRRNVFSAVPIPASSAAHQSSSHQRRYSRGQEFRFISEKINDFDMKDDHFLVVLDKGNKLGEPGFLIAEAVSEAATTTTIETTTLRLLENGLRVHGFPERPSLVSTLRLPNIDNSLLTYTLIVDRKGCHETERFSPMLRQSSWTMYEDRYAVNIVSKGSGVDINFHGDIPYYERVQLPGKRGIELRFWMDPTCPVPLSLNLQVDKYGSMGKVVIRYRMVVLVFTFLVVVLTLRAQFKAFNRGEPFMPFGVTLTQLITTTFWKFSALLAAIALVQSLQAKTTFTFEEPVPERTWNAHENAADEIIQGPGGVRSTSQTAYEQMIQARISRSESLFPNLRLEDALLGSNDTFFWFLAPVFFQVAIGIVIFIWVMLNALVRLFAALLRFMSNQGRRYVLGKAIGKSLSKRSRGVRRRVITTVVLFIMVATFVPYQFAFVVAVLVHIVSCVRSLRLAQATWYEPFSSDHRLDYIAPFIFFVEAVTDGAMVPRTPERGWQIFFMSRIWIVWLLILQLKDTEMASKLIKAVERHCWALSQPNKRPTY